MKNRHDIKDFILKIENDFPVHEWSIDQVDIWPILRVKLFLILVGTIERNNTKDKYKTLKPSRNNYILSKLKSLFKVEKIKSKKRLNKLEKVDYLFGSAYIYRSNYRGESFMKFADPLMDFTKNNSLVIEHSPLHYYDRNTIYKEERVSFLFELLNYTLLSKNRKQRIQKEKDINLVGYDEFLSVLKTEEAMSGKTDQFSLNTLNYLMNRFHDFEDIYSEILTKTQPKIVFTICHYSFQAVVLNYVANKRGIKTIEIQHGPQSEVHLAYASWSKIPEAGFNTLPKQFWNWDSYSYNEIIKWANNDTQHTCFIGGNPWVDFLKSNSNVEKKVILYSLQNLKFDDLFPDYIIEQIKLTTDFEWWLRLHPRQLEYMEELLSFFNSKGIEHVVNINEASNLPLPEILEKTKIHITNYSGCTLESSYFGVPSIIIDKRGFDAFKALIADGKAFYTPTKEEFNLKFSELIKSHISRQNESASITYMDILNNETSSSLNK